jgi:hypothetical protein
MNIENSFLGSEVKSFLESHFIKDYIHKFYDEENEEYDKKAEDFVFFHSLQDETIYDLKNKDFGYFIFISVPSDNGVGEHRKDILSFVSLFVKWRGFPSSQGNLQRQRIFAALFGTPHNREVKRDLLEEEKLAIESNEKLKLEIFEEVRFHHDVHLTPNNRHWINSLRLKEKNGRELANKIYTFCMQGSLATLSDDKLFEIARIISEG